MPSTRRFELENYSDWRYWDQDFRGMAKLFGLWKYIDPESPLCGQYPKQPVRPRLENYDRLRPTDPNSPVSITDLTDQGLKCFEIDLTLWRISFDEWTASVNWLAKLKEDYFYTLPDRVFRTNCQAGEPVHVWYASLKERYDLNKYAEKNTAREAWSFQQSTSGVSSQFGPACLVSSDHSQPAERLSRKSEPKTLQTRRRRFSKQKHRAAILRKERQKRPCSTQHGLI